MRSLVLAALVSASSVGFAAESFDLEKRGDQVCRVKSGKAEQCMPAFTGGLAPGRDRLELVDSVKAVQAFDAAVAMNPDKGLEMKDLREIAAALFLTNEEEDHIIKNYRRISVRNLALDPQLSEAQGGYIRIPFFASVYWQGRLMTEGTLHVEGYIVIPEETTPPSNDMPSVRHQLAEILKIERFSDSSTEHGFESLRNLETAARQIHFRMVGLNGQTVDEATQAFLTGLVGPMVLTEIIYLPFLEAVVNAISNMDKRTLEESLEGLGGSRETPPLLQKL